MATHASIFARIIPWTEELSGLLQNGGGLYGQKLKLHKLSRTRIGAGKE